MQTKFAIFNNVVYAFLLLISAYALIAQATSKLLGIFCSAEISKINPYISAIAPQKSDKFRAFISLIFPEFSMKDVFYNYFQHGMRSVLSSLRRQYRMKY